LTELEILLSGFRTVIAGVPAAETSDVRMCAVNCVALPNVVVREVPFTRTTAPFTKLVPVMLRSNAALPAGTVSGVSSVIVGEERCSRR